MIVVTLASALPEVAEGEPLPTEFRIFAAGVNETSKGPAVFDADAAAAVMAAFKRQGVRLMIDLEHESLDAPIRPDSRDARGSALLELRDGELWAVDVKWTPDGERRLREKTQRYTSPAFYKSKKTGRVQELVNVAICAMPATYHATPLVAASRGEFARNTPTATVWSTAMDPEKIKAAIEALKNEDGDAALKILEEMITGAGGDTPPSNTDAGAPTAESADAAVAAALTRELCELTGKPTLAEARAALKADRERVATLDADRLAIETRERVGLVAELVKLGAEKPAIAWVKDAKGDPTREPCERLSRESIASLRERVEAHRADAPKQPRPPSKDGASEDKGAPDVTKLAAWEIEAAKKKGWTPEQYAAAKRDAVVTR